MARSCKLRMRASGLDEARSTSRLTEFSSIWSAGRTKMSIRAFR